MGIADDMKRLTEDITASHDVRMKVLSDIVAEVGGLANETQETLKRFTEEREKMASGRKRVASEQAKALADFTADLTKNVSSMINGFREERGEMAEALKKKLSKKDIEARVEDIAKATRQLLGEYSSDMKEARASWQGMAGSVAKSGKAPAAPKVEAGEKVSTVKKATAKPRKKGGRKR